ncbi:hypothetical protein ACFL6O_04950 [candidate division KSB1 bacterium]
MFKSIFSVSLLTVLFLSNIQPVLCFQLQQSEVLKLELSFGAENLPEEYLLANPRGIAVNDRGEILIADENRIKVFDKNGKALKILGGEGQGPREFTNLGTITVSASGLLSAANNRDYNIYTWENLFIKKIAPSLDEKFAHFLTENNISQTSAVKKVYSIDENSKCIQFRSARERVNPKIFLMQKVLVFSSDEYSKVIASVPNYVWWRGRFLPYSGDLLWEVDDNNRIIYTRTTEDISGSTSGYYYKINILSDNEKKIVISRKYDPVKIPEVVYKEEMSSFNEKEVEQFLEKQLKETNYNYPPVKWLRIEGNCLYAGTIQENEHENLIVDVFNIDNNMYITSFYTAIDFDCVKNGYAYRIKREKNEFPLVEKYKIDSAFLGK